MSYAIRFSLLNQQNSKPALHWADGLLLCVALFWGANFAAVKFGLAEIPPLIFNALRYFIAALVMLSVVIGSGQFARLERKHLLYLIVIGVLGNTGYPLFFIYGLNATSADNAAMILSTAPIWVVLIGTFLKMERLSKEGWFAVIFSVFGILLVILGGRHQTDLQFGGATLLGDMMVIGAVLCWSGYTLALRPLTSIYSPGLISALGTSIGILPMVLLAVPSMMLFTWQNVSLAAWTSLVVTGVFAVGLAYLFWGYGVAHLGGTRTSLYLNVVPPIALLVNWLWLGETLTWLQWIGAIIALSGVAVARRHTAQLPSHFLDRLAGIKLET
ncbi:MAG: drug/metabolite transporter (DMT)-like permease [Cellvibrionaceae bacterium]|jgi:drug/metabolite transporter (DMT)-like permease